MDSNIQQVSFDLALPIKPPTFVESEGPTFHPFPRLPRELQERIWSFCLPEPKVICQINETTLQYVGSYHPASPALQASYFSRLVSSERYRHGTAGFRLLNSNGRVHYLDLDQDILLLKLPPLTDTLARPLPLCLPPEMRGQIKTVAVSLRGLPSRRYFCILPDSVQQKSVRSTIIRILLTTRWHLFDNSGLQTILVVLKERMDHPRGGNMCFLEPKQMPDHTGLWSFGAEDLRSLDTTLQDAWRLFQMFLDLESEKAGKEEELVSFFSLRLPKGFQLPAIKVVAQYFPE